MITATLQIIDKGRGPQLSSSRVTVQDILPFYRDGASNEMIRQWLPSLADDEIDLLRNYIVDHFDEVNQLEAEIKKYHDNQRARARTKDDLSIEERRQRILKKLQERRAENNDAHSSPG